MEILYFYDILFENNFVLYVSSVILNLPEKTPLLWNNIKFIFILSTFLASTRVSAKKHDCWEVAAGAAIGAGSSYIFTRPFARKYNLTISPVAGDGHYWFYASMNF